MQLFTKEILKELAANGRRSQEAQANCEYFDPYPVVKLFNPVGPAVWLLSETDPDEPDYAFGLCDLGMQCPELGSVLISEIVNHRGRLGLGIERDICFKPKHPLSWYTEQARRHQRIIA